MKCLTIKLVLLKKFFVKNAKLQNYLTYESQGTIILLRKISYWKKNGVKNQYSHRIQRAKAEKINSPRKINFFHSFDK